ncbi:MAG TPA: glycosyltransferase family 2 protein [Patescibacteria group bacterium]|nr:glycosyltransferase family 2 protein [Patescibacteria group bacterium]
MLLSIITLNYKKPELTLRCLDSLHQQFEKEFQSAEMEVIVVDNDSQDDSVEKMGIAVAKKKYLRIRILASGKNGGFGKGNNFGAKHAKGDFFVFLNNDTVVEDRGLLDMAQYMKTHQEVALLGGQLTNPDGSLQASTGKFYTLFYVFLLLLGFQKFGLLDNSPKKISRVDWVKGGLLMIRRDAFEKLKGFDERIFMYTEDMELCYRAKKEGLSVWFYPDIKVTHAEHGSGNRAFAIKYIYQGLLYFYKKHKSELEYHILKIMLIAKAKIAIAVGFLTGKQELVKTYQDAIKF